MTERTFSFEFFPPKTAEGVEKLRATRKQLAQLNPKFFSVTFGAGGSTRDRTLETVREIQADGSEAAPHLSCIGSTEENIRDILNEYKSQGIRHLVALRGDLPSGSMDAGEFHYANELVAFIRAETGDWFEIEVAAYPEIHPQARSWTEDLANFKRKVDAGANAAITQYFFNADAYFHFVDECARAGRLHPHRARHHADRQLRAAGALFRCLRRGNPALAAEKAGKLRRRPAVHSRLRPGCGDRPVRPPARRRRAGAAFLHHEPGRAQHHHLAAAGLC